jgi:hypothetical protein
VYESLHKLPLSIKVLFFCIGLTIFLSISSIGFLIWRNEAIHNAARRGDVREIEEILDRHPERIETQNRLGVTPL